MAVPDRVEGYVVHLLSFLIEVNVNGQVRLRIVGRIEVTHAAGWHSQATHDCSTDRQNTGSQNPSDWWASSHLTPLPTQGPLEQVLRTVSRWLWNISKDIDSITSLGTLCQCLATLTVERALFPGLDKLCLSPLVLSLSITKKSLSVPHSFLSGIYTQGSDLQSLLFSWLSGPGSQSLSLRQALPPVLLRGTVTWLASTVIGVSGTGGGSLLTCVEDSCKDPALAITDRLLCFVVLLQNCDTPNPVHRGCSTDVIP